MPKINAVWLGFTVSCLMVAGCGESLPETVPVAGTVTYNGKPLDSGTVTFQPDQIKEGLPRRPAKGVLDPQGNFHLSTFRNEDGAVPGTYRVTIHSYLPPAGPIDDREVYTPTWRIPERYGNPQTSGLTAEVTPDQARLQFDFDLQDN